MNGAECFIFRPSLEFTTKDLRKLCFSLRDEAIEPQSIYMQNRSCLIVAPIQHTGMGTQGYYWTRHLLPKLQAAGFEVNVAPNGDLNRQELATGSPHLLDQKLQQALKPINHGFGNPAFSILLCLPAQFDQMPGEQVIAYIIFEGSRLRKEDCLHLQRAQHIAVASQWAKEIVIQSFQFHGLPFSGQIFIWPEGVDADLYQPQSDLNPASGPLAVQDAVTFVNVGKFEIRKGQSILVNAFAEMKIPEGKSLRLLGHWANYWNAEWMKQAIELLRAEGFAKEIPIPNFPLKRFVHSSSDRKYVDLLTGHLASSDQMLCIYRAADFGIYPYFSEAWNLPLIETLACGVPCAATAYSGPMEFLNKTPSWFLRKGKMVEARDTFGFQSGEDGEWMIPSAEELKGVMEEMSLLSVEERSQRGWKSSKVVRTYFSWEASAQKTFEDLRSHFSG